MISLRVLATPTEKDSLMRATLLAAALAAACLLAACGGSDDPFPADATDAKQTTMPVDCVAHPVQCR